MKSNCRRTATVCLSALFAFILLGCGSNQTASGGKPPGLEEAVSTATDAYIYGYPLVTMDMTRKQFTNVAVPDAAHAPMGQILKLRTYPAVDNHAVTAPNADTLYTTTWLDVSNEPWILSVPDMGDRYYLLPMLDGWTDVFQVPGKRTTGDKAAEVCHHWAGMVGHAARRRDGIQISHRNGLDSRSNLLHRHSRGLRGSTCRCRTSSHSFRSVRTASPTRHCRARSMPTST